MSDSFSDWDAAYVLGSLSATERREFERHLATCDSCSASVAELAGMPGLLSKVPASEATTLLDTAPPAPIPSTLLPRLVRSARRRQRRIRGLIAGGVVAAAAAAAAIVLVVPLVFTGAPSGTTSDRVVSLSRVVPNPLSASIRLTSEGWGTRLEMDCHYGPPPTAGAYRAGDAGSAKGYALYVTDASGKSVQVATWSAAPGSTVEPSGTTSLSLSQIASVDVRSITDGTVLLKGTV